MIEWKKNFFKIWTGQAISQLTSSIIQFAIVWYLTDKSGSALILSLAMFIGFMPQALLGPFIGVYIDRYNRKKIMIFSDLFIALVSLILVVAGVFGELSIILILFVLFLRSIGTAFHQPALHAVTPQIVPTAELTKCAGYSQSLESISQLISPAIAAVLYSIWNLNSIIFLDVIGAVIAIICLLVSQIPKPNREKDLTKPKVIKEAIEGFRILKSNKGVMGLVLIGTLYTIALMPTSALFPLMSMSYFGGTSTYASIAEIAFSVGLLIGSVILGIWGGTKNKMYTIVGSFLLMAFSLLYTGLLSPDQFVVFAILSCMMGLSGPFYWGMNNTILQQSVESNYMGRIMSLSASIRLISAPIGLSISGIIADVFGVEKWFLLAGVITLVAALLCLFIPSIRHCDEKVINN